MARILEKIGECWNDVNLLYIDEVCKKGLVVNNEVRDSNNLILLERDTGHTKKLFFNKDVRDATDDLCDILSEWCNCFLRYYNLGLYKALHNGQLQCKLRRFMRSDSHNFRNDTK
uniref:Uncharacterized protein n=1 Tax=Rhizophagus irregularis (strain DAOM 181602 / DAOM 197198 / MUCL 43194) TaxID=747089 RepID=U9TV34_RHIID